MKQKHPFFEDQQIKTEMEIRSPKHSEFNSSMQSSLKEKFLIIFIEGKQTGVFFVKGTLMQI